MHKKNVITAGKDLKDAKKALILLHGRGATAEDILTLAEHLNVDDYALFAPQASNFTWYPYSFLASPELNEPWLSSAIEIVSEVVRDIQDAGISSKDILWPCWINVGA